MHRQRATSDEIVFLSPKCILLHRQNQPDLDGALPLSLCTLEQEF